MPGAGEKKIKVRRVNPYPIPVVLELPQGPFQAEIALLTTVGCVIEVSNKIFKTGDKFDVKFSIPVLGHFVQCHCMVVKLYDKAVRTSFGGKGTQRVVEAHFRDLAPELHRNILEFTIRIGQKK